MINKVTLIGRLGNAPEVRRLEGGAVVARVSLATSDAYKDKEGNFQENTEWHNVVAWRELAERVEKLAKGALVYVEGKVTYRKYTDKDNIERNVCEIVANMVRPLEKKEQADPNQIPAPQPAQTESTPFLNPPSLNGNDLPF
jgi:single-strand DNA-binding protein